MHNQIIESWHINNKVNLMLLDAVSDEGLRCTLSKRGGRNVALQFAHIHNNRIYRLEKYAKDLLEEQCRIEADPDVSREIIKQKLIDSEAVYAEWFSRAIEDGGIVKGFKRGAIVMLGYFISHEAHHRGSIMLTLKQSGYPVPKEIRDGIWAWNQI